MHSLDRRRLLAGGAAALAGLAGCFGSNGDSGGDPDSGDGLPGAPGDPPAFADGLFAPGAAGGDPYAFAHADVSTVAGTSEYDALKGGKLHGMTSSAVGADGSTFAEGSVSEALSIEYATGDAAAGLLTGSFDVASIREEYEALADERDDASADGYGEYDLYTVGTRAAAMRAGDPNVFLDVAAGSGDRSRAVATALIDARRGDADAYGAVDDRVAHVLGRLPEADLSLVDPSPSPGAIDAEGRSARWRNGTLLYTVVAIASASEPDPARLLDAGAYGTDLSHWTHEVDGRVVRFDLEYDPENPEEIIAVDRESPPRAKFNVAFDRDAGEAEVEHAGGESADASQLFVVIEGDGARRIAWSDRSSDGAAIAGESITVALEDSEWGGRLSVEWLRSDRRRRETLVERSIPE